MNFLKNNQKLTIRLGQEDIIDVIRSKVIISYKNEELLLNIVQYNIKFKVKPT